jgi:hypothetical protein
VLGVNKVLVESYHLPVHLSRRQDLDEQRYSETGSLAVPQYGMTRWEIIEYVKWNSNAKTNIENSIQKIVSGNLRPEFHLFYIADAWFGSAKNMKPAEKKSRFPSSEDEPIKTMGSLH